MMVMVGLSLSLDFLHTPIWAFYLTFTPTQNFTYAHQQAERVSRVISHVNYETTG